MAWVKGQSGNRQGRKPGALNKMTVLAKEAFQLAFIEMGGPAALGRWAKKNQTEFYKLYSKLLPMDVTSGGEKVFKVVYEDKPLNEE